MKNKKGFTLIELLAVIVILAIITAVVSSTLIKTKKRSNIENVKTYESTLENLGMQIYVYDKLSETLKNVNDYKDYKIADLKSSGYIEDLSNPQGGNCEGYLRITQTAKGPEFKGYVDCPDLYTTPGYQK